MERKIKIDYFDDEQKHLCLKTSLKNRTKDGLETTYIKNGCYKLSSGFGLYFFQHSYIGIRHNNSVLFRNINHKNGSVQGALVEFEF